MTNKKRGRPAHSLREPASVSGLDASCWQTIPPRPGRTADSGSSWGRDVAVRARASSGMAMPSVPRSNVRGAKPRGVAPDLGPCTRPALSRTGAPILLRDVWGPSLGPRRYYQSCILLPRSSPAQRARRASLISIQFGGRVWGLQCAASFPLGRFELPAKPRWLDYTARMA
jgi:hypothetical protein